MAHTHVQKHYTLKCPNGAITKLYPNTSQDNKIWDWKIHSLTKWFKATITLDKENHFKFSSPDWILDPRDMGWIQLLFP